MRCDSAHARLNRSDVEVLIELFENMGRNNAFEILSQNVSLRQVSEAVKGQTSRRLEVI
jgi:hypothetical protein